MVKFFPDGLLVCGFAFLLVAIGFKIDRIGDCVTQLGTVLQQSFSKEPAAEYPIEDPAEIIYYKFPVEIPASTK